MTTWKLALLGAAAGAAGTTALNAVTYLDMALRGRPSSNTPEQTVEALSELLHLPVPGQGEARQNRIAGLGPITGLAAGVGIGSALGLSRAAGWRPRLAAASTAATVGALLGTNGPMTVLGVTDPRTWPVSSWLADIVPHVAYGVVTAAVLERLTRG
ncbi:MAG: hypothetical protein LC789_06795 [Actinobacteria bacterium]|nr:hypothetical protein [Actinomycetota bacterium]MCA1720150.1 hypothetical protein [Actinomycetota bacterium]